MKFARICQHTSTALHVAALLLTIRAVMPEPVKPKRVAPKVQANLLPYTFDKDLWGALN